MSRAEIDTMLAEIKANNMKLDTCPRHDFSIVLDRHTKQPIESATPAQRFGAKFQCARCAGIVDGIARIWYERGLKHAVNA
jgi:hypothetical protein